MDKKFTTAINCIDGRVQKPVAEYIQRKFGVDYVDMITEPGPNKVLAENSDTSTINSLKEKVILSVVNRKPEVIFIAAHYNCLANPTDESTQKNQLRKAVDTITSWKLPVKKIIALWLDQTFEPSIIS